ncbi:amino acid adenylation domain-containing protein [Streptomyces sp. NPDC001811]
MLMQNADPTTKGAAGVPPAPPGGSGHRPLLGPGAEHSLVVRLTGPSSLAAARTAFDRAARPAVDDGAGFWTESMPFPSDDPRAEHLVRREALRGSPGERPRLRAVLVTYSDDAADLVLVAHRTLLDREALRRLADALAGQGEPDVPAEAVRPRTPPWRTAPDTSPEPPLWGLAEGGGSPVSQGPAEPADVLPQPGTPEVAVAAAALVLARYEGTATVTLAVPALPGARPGSGGLLTVTADDERTVAELIEQVRQRPPAPDGTGAPTLAVVVCERLPGERYRPLLAPTVPLTLLWEAEQDRLIASGTVSDDRAVHPGQAARFQECVQYVARQLYEAAPDRTLGEIELVPPDRAARIEALGRTGGPRLDSGLTIHDAVGRMARTRPDAVALTGEDGTLTYGELDSRATARAHALRASGVTPGSFVGVCLERTADLVVTLLAVLKAGAAYVPLDPAYPADRLRYVCEDAAVSLVVTTVADFPAGDGVRVLAPSALHGFPEVPLPAVASDAAAYVIYTSGTTGRPKGVVVPHRNVLALLAATTGPLELGPHDVWTLFHSSAFDFSVWEIWGCLMTGGRLVVVPFLTTRSPQEFHALLVHERVTVLNQTPSAFSALLDADARQGGGLLLRLVVFGGEALDPRMLRPWFRRYPTTVCRMVNMYGITETTVHVTAQDVTPVQAGPGSSCVGRALPGWSVSVRDERGRVLPIGVAGEIHVGGAGVARHYLNRADLTAERFVHDGRTGERRYRSGDRGRMRPDGSLDHLGRLDEQVKLRGFRIELGEVRSVLLGDPAVAEAAVILDEGTDTAYARLVAYVVLRHGTTADVRRRVGTVLPEHMVPAAIVSLPALPLTVNGKLDRSRLPAPAGAAEPGPAPAEAPTGHGASPVAGTAETVLAVWRTVLDEATGPDDDFFEMGGNSLAAVRLLAALRDLGLPALSPRDLYVHRTAAKLAALADARGARS